MAAIGEQFMECLAPGDDICGLSVSPREKDDLIQIWNKDKQVEPESHVLEKVHQLVPDVRFNAEFYKRKHDNDPIQITFPIKSDSYLQLTKLIQPSVRRIENLGIHSIIHSDKIPSIMECIHTEKKKRTQTKKNDETIANTQGLKTYLKITSFYFLLLITRNLKSN